MPTSLNAVLIVALLIAPGYITLGIIRRRHQLSRIRSDVEFVVATITAGVLVQGIAGVLVQGIAYDGTSEVSCIFYFLIDPDALEAVDAPQNVVSPPGDEAVSEESGQDGNASAAPHSLTIQFWECPEGTDPAADQSALQQTCSVESGERSFILTIDGDSMGQTITGSATWEFQHATVYADIGVAEDSSAWCGSTWSGGVADAADSTDSVSLESGLLTVTVSNPATTVACDWFIFPP